MKKIITCVMAFTLLFTFSATVMAASSTNDAEYRQVLNEINEEYNLNLGYSPVDPEVVSLSEYEEIVRSVAIQQSRLNDFIAHREEHPLSETSKIVATSTTKTITKDVWQYENYFSIRATYNVEGTLISNPRDISVRTSILALLSGLSYTPYGDSPTTKIIDTGSTLTVTYYGTLSGENVDLLNVMFYTEFYYDS